MVPSDPVLPNVGSKVNVVPLNCNLLFPIKMFVMNQLVL
jgi:hypothetical protein